MKVWEHGATALRGKVDRVVEDTALRGTVPLLDAFLDDADLQEVRIASSNLGIALTFRKLPGGAEGVPGRVGV